MNSRRRNNKIQQKTISRLKKVKRSSGIKKDLLEQTSSFSAICSYNGSRPNQCLYYCCIACQSNKQLQICPVHKSLYQSVTWTNLSCQSNYLSVINSYIILPQQRRSWIANLGQSPWQPLSWSNRKDQRGAFHGDLSTADAVCRIPDHQCDGQCTNIHISWCCYVQRHHPTSPSTPLSLTETEQTLYHFIWLHGANI